MSPPKDFDEFIDDGIKSALSSMDTFTRSVGTLVAEPSPNNARNAEVGQMGAWAALVGLYSDVGYISDVTQQFIDCSYRLLVVIGGLEGETTFSRDNYGSGEYMEKLTGNVRERLQNAEDRKKAEIRIGAGVELKAMMQTLQEMRRAG